MSPKANGGAPPPLSRGKIAALGVGILVVILSVGLKICSRPDSMVSQEEPKPIETDAPPEASAGDEKGGEHSSPVEAGSTLPAPDATTTEAPEKLQGFASEDEQEDQHGERDVEHAPAPTAPPPLGNPDLAPKTK